MMKLTTATARRDLANVIKRVRSTRQRVVITRYGQPLVAVISIEDLARLDRGSAGPARRAGGKSSGAARRR